MLLDSPTMSIYNQRLADFKAKYPTGAVKYCTDTWLIWKENLVTVYINQHVESIVQQLLDAADT